jgi:gamma-glutamylcyclotransferase (GGCT)/AIG2-like uncharacterized protein YtfP
MKVRLLLPDYHFGYGSNLNWDDWKKWCSERGKDPNSLKVEPGTFFLPDYELDFHYYSGGRDGGALDVVKLRGHAVAGKLFKVSDDGWDSLDAKEGHPTFYERKKVEVLSENGELRTAITYVVVPDRVKKEHVPPRPNYIEAVERGYEYHGITISNLIFKKAHLWAKTQLLASAKGKVTKSAVNHLFIYGTLREGEERAEILSEFSSKVYKDCKIRGKLINLQGGRYPGLISGDGSVVGEIHHTPKIQNALKKLDNDVEDFKGYGEDGSLFHRVLTYSNNIPCWTYVYAGSPDDGPVIESGDWLKR